MAVVDVDDSLTTDRPYRSAMPSAVALSLMEEEDARGWWDGHLFQEFRNLIACQNLALSGPQPVRPRTVRWQVLVSTERKSGQASLSRYLQIN